MALEQNKQIIQRFMDEVLNDKNLSAMDEIVAEDFIEHVPFPGQGPGREGLRHTIAGLISAFPDMKWTTDERVAEGDTVVTRFTWTGTHNGDFLGMPATGKSIEVWGVVIDVVRDGLFAESRIILDMPTLMQQLTSNA
ncbi:hypothetical protein CCAX7_28330 [Capsulimonas corticalis]|uniref:Uncharacterized protein n=1 Tax=Capsulimonas corticalis TaxID=2219043 RepID=A0A402CTD2_9BACT|nr:ester cyclase [Capsulimonas corticalis]BDI30782.1 hypothetical protein CCAX7_28330 [Capsulimonas corticalis]